MPDPMFSDVVSNFDTKMLVFDTTAELMRTTPLDKLSVSKICAAANISHATFYRHFQDKYAIGQWHVLYASSLGTAKIGRSLTWREGYYITETAIAERFDFYINAGKSNDPGAIDNFAPLMRRSTLMRTLDDLGIAITPKLQVEIDATAKLETFLMPRWHYGEYDVTLNEMCDWVADLVPRELFELLNTPIKPKQDADRRPPGLRARTASARVNSPSRAPLVTTNIPANPAPPGVPRR